MKTEITPGAKLRYNFLNTLVTIYGIIENQEAEAMFRAFYGEELYDDENIKKVKDDTIKSIDDLIEEIDNQDNYIASCDDDDIFIEGIFSFIEMDGVEYICNYMLTDPTIICWVFYVHDQYDRYDAVNAHCPLFNKDLLMRDDDVYDYPICDFGELKQYLMDNYGCDDKTAILIARTPYYTQRSASFPINIDHVFGDIYIQLAKHNLDVERAIKDPRFTHLVTSVYMNTRRWHLNGHTLNEVSR